MRRPAPPHGPPPEARRDPLPGRKAGPIGARAGPNVLRHLRPHGPDAGRPHRSDDQLRSQDHVGGRGAPARPLRPRQADRRALPQLAAGGARRRARLFAPPCAAGAPGAAAGAGQHDSPAWVGVLALPVDRPPGGHRRRPPSLFEHRLCDQPGRLRRDLGASVLARALADHRLRRDPRGAARRRHRHGGGRRRLGEGALRRIAGGEPHPGKRRRPHPLHARRHDRNPAPGPHPHRPAPRDSGKRGSWSFTRCATPLSP